MKKLTLTFLMCIVAIVLNAQTMQDSCNVKNTTKDELWKRAKDFCLSRHDFALNVSSYDKEIGVIIFNIKRENRDFSSFSELNIGFTARVKIENNKYSVEIYDGTFSLKPTPQAMGDVSYMPSEVLEMIKDELTFIEDIYDYKTIDRLNMNLSVYRELQGDYPKYNKPKDEKKGKVNYRWEYYQKKIERAERVINWYKYAAIDFKGELFQKMINASN